MLQIEGSSASGSNESQQALQSCQVESKNLIKDEWLLCIYEKFSNHAINLIRLCFCISIGLFLATSASAQDYNEISNNVVASSDILLDKSLRGVFPPLQGRQTNLYGKWQMSIITEIQGTSRRFNNYNLNFKSNHIVELTHKDCNGDIKLKCFLLYYNMLIKKLQTNSEDQSQSDMEIPNEQEDIKCINGTGEFENILLNVSIWTVHENILYMISQINTNAGKMSKMLILKRK